LLLGGGWRGAAWVGCREVLALDRVVDEERTFAFLDVRTGQLFPAAARGREELAVDPAVVDALVAAFGEDAAFPEDRVALGALRRSPDGMPAVEVIGSGQEEDPDVVVALEPLPLPAPVERAVAAAAPCGQGEGVRWVLRSPRGGEVLPGPDADALDCPRLERGGEGAGTPPADSASAVVGTSAGRGDVPVVLSLAGGRSVTLPDSSPWDAYSTCTWSGSAFVAARVEQPGLYGFDVLYVVPPGTAEGVRAAYYDVSSLDVAGVGAVGDAVLYGGPGGWFLARSGEDPVRLSDFAPAVKP
jgi:hypothetical protein